jgi:transcriptional regulator with XRE-family HTH domain
MSKMDEWEAARAAYLKGFAANVKRIRKEKGLSQFDLELEAKLHRTGIGRYEAGKTEPGLITAAALAQGLSVTIDELVAGLTVPVHRPPSAQEQGKRKGKGR